MSYDNFMEKLLDGVEVEWKALVVALCTKPTTHRHSARSRRIHPIEVQP